MFKLFSFALLLTLSVQFNSGNIITNDGVLAFLSNPEYLVDESDTYISSVWEEHLQDFLELIDTDQLLMVVMGYLSDPEVLNFVSFIFSDDFKQLAWDFESMAEFKEAFKFLTEKGYEMDSVLEYINNALNLPPFEKPKVIIPINRNGVNGLVQDLIAALPVDEIKELFEQKLQNNPEVAQLFETINSPQFMDIMKRMSENPEFERFIEIFESYGFDFNYLCGLAKDIFGEYYQGVFCH